MFNLPKLIIFIIGALAVWYGYRAVKRELARVKTQLRDADKESQGETKIQSLKKDKDGVYRLDDDEDDNSKS